MALEVTGKDTMLGALDVAITDIQILNSVGGMVDTQTLTFAVNGISQLVLSANVVFSVAAGTVVGSVRARDVNQMALFTATLSGTEAERTYTYAGTYTLTALTVTLS